jgi:hypothetical protein
MSASLLVSHVSDADRFMSFDILSGFAVLPVWARRSPFPFSFSLPLPLRSTIRLVVSASLFIIATPTLAQIPLPAPAFAPTRPQTPTGDTVEVADRNTDQTIRYLVYTTPATDRRLDQVRRFVPEASFGDLSGDLVIQAGLFSSEAAASDRLIALASQGIAAEILQVQVNPPRPATLPEADAFDGERGYYVIVPGQAGELDGLAASLRSLLGETTIAVLDEPFGTHISIGPFEVRDDAELVQNLLRDRDVSKARVYYDRNGSLF